MKTRKISPAPSAGPKTSPARAGEVEARSAEGEGDRVAPNPTFSTPSHQPHPRARHLASEPQRADPITLTLGAARLDLSRTRGRGFEPRPGPTPP
jgi:hypothetical protein